MRPFGFVDSSTYGMTVFQSVAFSPDSKLIAASNDKGTVFIWDVATLEKIGQLQANKGIVGSIAFSPDGKRLASGGGISLFRCRAFFR